MAVSIRNVKKYFEDHLELADIKDKVIKGAEKEAKKGKGIICAGTMKNLLGAKLSHEFFKEVTENFEHIKMGLEDFRKAG